MQNISSASDTASRGAGVAGRENDEAEGGEGEVEPMAALADVGGKRKPMVEGVPFAVEGRKKLKADNGAVIRADASVEPSPSVLPVAPAPASASLIAFGDVRYVDKPRSGRHVFGEGAADYDWRGEIEQQRQTGRRGGDREDEGDEGSGDEDKQGEGEGEGEGYPKYVVEKYKFNDFCSPDPLGHCCGGDGSHLGKIGPYHPEVGPLLMQPRKLLVPRVSNSTKLLMRDSMSEMFSSCTVPHQGVKCRGYLYVSHDGVFQHLHSSRAGGATRRDVVAMLMEGSNMGKEWVKWNLLSGRRGVGGIVDAKTKERMYLTSLFSSPDAPPPTSSYVMDPYCRAMLKNHERTGGGAPGGGRKGKEKGKKGYEYVEVEDEGGEEEGGGADKSIGKINFFFSFLLFLFYTNFPPLSN